MIEEPRLGKLSEIRWDLYLPFALVINLLPQYSMTRFVPH